MKKNKLIKNKPEQPFLTLYVHFLYKYIGRYAVKNKKFKKFFYEKIYNKKYNNILKKANLKILPEEYFLSIYITILLLSILIFITSLIFLFFNSFLSMFLFYGGIFVLFLIGISFYNYPIILAKNRGIEIDASMPYILPYMKILSKEINLSKIIEIIDEFLIYKEIREEFRKIKYYSEFLGYDIHSSIREAMLSCPSRKLSDLMNDLVTISNSGGDIYSYLSRKLDNLNEEIIAIEKKNIDTLLIMSQIYVVILLISPLFFTIMSTILNLINFSTNVSSSSGGTDTVVLIVGLLIFLPVAYIMFMMLVYYSKPLYSRLKSIEKN